jgi:type II secretory pathway predicted ATPase ExeA
MPTIERLHQALINADSAGDTEAATAIAAEIRKMQSAAPVAQPAIEKRQKLDKGYLESLGAGLGAGVGNVALGAQNLVGMGLEKLGAESAGRWLQENAAMGKRNIQAELQPYKEANPYTAGGGELAGEIVSTLPVGGALAKGVQAIPQISGRVPTLVNALRTGGLGKGSGNVATRMAGGGITGGTSAALINPEEAGTGAAIGAAIPGGLGVIKGVKALAYDPLMNQQQITGKLITSMAGSPQLAYEAMQNIRKGGAQTPGLTLSAGQMGGNVGLSALEDAIATQNAAGALSNKVRQQNAILAKELRKISGTAEDIESATAAVQKKSNVRYENAKNAGFVPETYTPEAQQNIKKFMERIPNELFQHAQKLAQVEGIELTEKTAVQGLHWLKEAIDDVISKAVNQGNNRVANAYMSLKNDLLTGLENMQPLYKTAREAHAAAMKPINQMQVGKYLEEKLIPAGSTEIPERLNYRTLAQQLRNPDTLAQRATGFSGATLENTLTPQQINAIKGAATDAATIADSMQRAVGATGQSATARRLATGGILAQHLANEAPITSKVLQFLSNAPGVGVVGRATGMVSDLITKPIESNILRNVDEMLANNPKKVADLIAKEIGTMDMPTREKVISALPQAVVKALPATVASMKE